VVSVERGMTRDQVVGLIGPPFSVTGYDEFLASYDNVFGVRLPQRRRLRDRFRRAARDLPPLPEPVSWLYAEVPEGHSTVITFKNGVVEMVSSQPYERAGTGLEHEWAREMVVTHLGRTSADSQRLAAHLTRLAGAEVLDFVLDAHGDAYPPIAGRIGANLRRFGELTVLVSMFRVTTPQKIRGQLPGGYMTHLFWLLDEFHIRLGESDVAHWILCHDDRGDQVVHVSFMPGEKAGINEALLPVDLLSSKERRRYMR